MTTMSRSSASAEALIQLLRKRVRQVGVKCKRSGLVNERQERAQILGLKRLEASLPMTCMIGLRPGGATEPGSVSPMTDALDHPGIRACIGRAHAHGGTVAVDTSLRAPALPSTPAALGIDLHSIGAYFNPQRACIGLAPDTAWHELVHEMVHLMFNKRVHSNGPATAAAYQGRLHEPLSVHFTLLKRRGHSVIGAEERVCREHELYALRSSRSFARRLVVYDNTLVDAQLDLEQLQHRCSEQHKNALAELRRINLLRTFVTGPRARLMHILGWCATFAVGTGAAFASLTGAHGHVW